MRRETVNKEHAMTRRDKRKTAKHTRLDGATGRTSGSDHRTPDPTLIDAIRENLSPQAVALIIAKCQPVYGTGEAGKLAEREVAWFTEQLIGAIGVDQFNQMCDELGV